MYLCTTPGQKDGWVPGQVISWISETSGIAKETYTAKELDVNSGNVFVGDKRVERVDMVHEPIQFGRGMGAIKKSSESGE